MDTNHTYSQHTNSKRTFLQISSTVNDQYSEQYDLPILNSIKRRFMQNCEASDVPEKRQLPVMHTMFRNEALRYFTDDVVCDAKTVDGAFNKMKDHFITLARSDALTKEWCSMQFANMRAKYRNNSSPIFLTLSFKERVTCKVYWRNPTTHHFC